MIAGQRIRAGRIATSGGGGGGLLPHQEDITGLTIAEGETGPVTTLSPVPYNGDAVTLYLNGVAQPRDTAWSLEADGLIVWLATAPTGLVPDDALLITWQSTS